MFGALAGGGAAIGLIVGGVLTEYASWRWCLGVNVPVALIVAGCRGPARAREQGARRHPLRRPRRAARHDRPVLAGLRLHRGRPGQAPRGPDDTSVQGWADPTTITFLVAAVVLLVAFVLWETRGQEPDAAAAGRARPQPRRRRTWSFLLVGAGLFAMFLFLTYYFQINLGYSPLKAGFAFLPFSAGIILTAGRGGAAAAPASGRSRSWSSGWRWRSPACCWLTQIGAGHVLLDATCCRPSC